MMSRKGVYPYSFATSIPALFNKTELPDKHQFSSDLTDEQITEKDYSFAKKVWTYFGCKNMHDYTVLYLKSDVRLLADCIFDFRKRIWKIFGLDLTSYLSLPHLSFDAMLKMTGAEIGKKE